ncbi:DUF4145 domain-containing protein [Shewanella dokdonensis]|uniref:DUF4145 domain-containing protein n=1 Tax=Shewanella dokdonensis TaxID=712036 RepID=UPI001FD1392E|nr:DUF4145 domain-containing protein [Shewanella dokdonensis]MCL1075701.1 DUF4145 domain-containing protein [Shewanella dokdonensis]
MNDIELVAGVSDALATEYRSAKRYVSDVPTQSLLHVRSFAHRLTALLAEPKAVVFDSPNLYDRIEQLNRLRLIDVRITRALHRLRADGNRGAHPEKYHLDQPQLQQLAQKAIRDLLKLVELVYPLLRQCPAPAYQFDEYDALSGRELCFRAVMQDDSEAQYLLGMSFKSQALMARQQEQALADSELPPPQQAKHYLSKAAYWFAQAATQEPRARFEHGVALLHGYSGEPDLAAGQQLIREAAEAGVVDAMALLGYFYLVGSGDITADLVLAEQYLKAAAEQEHTEAMANLGVLRYQQGNLPAAFQHIKQAAQSGYPHAQYHLSLMLARGEGCQADLAGSEQWLAEAAEQGQLEAMLARAQHMLNQEQAFGSDMSQAESYLRQVIRYGHSVPAMIELAIALTDGSLARIDVVEAAAWLKLAKSRGDAHEQQIITPLWQSLAQQVERALALSQEQAEQRSLQRAKELLTD